MSEIYIEINPHHPIDVFGLQEERLNKIRAFFPLVNIVLRGDLLKAAGDKASLNDFERKMKLVLFHYDRFNRLTDADIDDILGENGKGKEAETETAAGPKDGYILSGNNGKIIKALTKNQQVLTDAVKKNDLVFAIGPAGSGKTYTAVALAVKALKEKEVKRIILTRPAVEAGENLGFLPGDLKEKLDPYMQPLYDALRDMIPYRKLLTLLEESTIEIAPLAFMRGRTLDHAFVILDEAQNATESQMKMFLTRMGKNAKFVITGDITQIDLPPKQYSGLVQAQRILKNTEGVSMVQLTDRDVVRHKLVAAVISAYAKDAAERLRKEEKHA